MTVLLTSMARPEPLVRMAQPTQENFSDYKHAEAKALEIMREMKATSPKKVDIELALLVALFELHKGSTAPGTIAKIVQSHMETLVPFYNEIAVAKKQSSSEE